MPNFSSHFLLFYCEFCKKESRLHHDILVKCRAFQSDEKFKIKKNQISNFFLHLKTQNDINDQIN